MSSIDVIGLTAERAMGMLRAGECTSEELAQAYLDRIAAVDGDVHSYLHVDPERTLAAARAQDASGGDALSGVPIAYKDLLSTKDVPTTAGSKILEGFVPIQDADVVARGNEAGLVSLGKTNLDEFAMGSSTEHSAYGPTHNPWDLTRVPGGSSGGSAAVVASGCAPWSLGTDTGGSIRQPAAFCGLVGLMPTYGTVSRFGVIAFACSLEQVGPMALTVRDAALLQQVIAKDSPTTRRAPVRASRSRCPTQVASMACASVCRGPSSRRVSSRVSAPASTSRSPSPRTSAPRSWTSRCRTRAMAWLRTT